VRIVGCDLFRYDIALSEPAALKRVSHNSREGALLRLTLDDGSEGWGEAAPLPGFSPESLKDTVEQLRGILPSLKDRHIPGDRPGPGEDPFPDVDLSAPSARFGIEAALLNLSAWSREGTAPGPLTDTPAQAIQLNGLVSGPIEKMLAKVVSMKEDGYTALKLKVGRRSVAEDAEAVRGVAGVLGGEVSLRLDANRAWSVEEALAFAEEISGVRVAYVEEPLADPGRLAELAGEWGLPVALDESLVGMAPEELAGHPYAVAVVLKPTLLGGVWRTLRLAEEARAIGMAPVVSSSYEAGVGTGALVALAATIGGEPAGLDTYRALAGDVTEAPLPLPAPTVDVRRAMEAARKVDVRRLEPIPLR
jgi:O-succinylbenzoate synthase